MKDRIRKIMESQHMSQKEFAQFTGISEGSLSGVFNGRTRPTLQMVEAIHEHLGNVSVEWIMFGSGPMYTDDSTALGSKDVEGAVELSVLPEVKSGGAGASLFDNQELLQIPNEVKGSRSIEKNNVKYIDKPERKITEIRIFYDDQTWETFEPKR